MNIFYLNADPSQCAKEHIDKHVVKMILEYGQLMSTAHRLLDGIPYTGKTLKGRNIQRWLLPDNRESILWKASHVKHPSNIWLRSSSQHYKWLFNLWCEMLTEYTHRYGKQHAASRMKDWFKVLPSNIPSTGWFTDPTPAMPEEYKSSDVISSYRNYYKGSKRTIASWKNRDTPTWFI